MKAIYFGKTEKINHKGKKSVENNIETIELDKELSDRLFSSVDKLIEKLDSNSILDLLNKRR